MYTVRSLEDTEPCKKTKSFALAVSRHWSFLAQSAKHSRGGLGFGLGWCGDGQFAGQGLLYRLGTQSGFHVTCCNMCTILFPCKSIRQGRHAEEVACSSILWRAEMLDRAYWGFPTRMVYLKHDIEQRYTILVRNPRYYVNVKKQKEKKRRLVCYV